MDKRGLVRGITRLYGTFVQRLKPCKKCRHFAPAERGIGPGTFVVLSVLTRSRLGGKRY